MSDDNRAVLMIAAFLALWFWQKGGSTVTLTQTCIFPDGFTVTVPLGSDCPYDLAHGGQSQLLTQ